jgi:Flp pilus assembly protein TadG
VVEVLRNKPRLLNSADEGATLVEFALVLPLLVLVLGLTFDFALAYWQYNAGLKALERGARIAAVSDPVATNLLSLNAISAGCTGTCTGGEGALSTPNSYNPSFTVTCSGSTASCSAPGTGWNPTTMQWIVYGRGRTACTTVSSAYEIGMCHLLSMLSTPLAPENVQVVYASGGLGYYKRPSGPIVTIKVQFDPANPPSFKFFFLGNWLFAPLLLKYTNAQTLTSEDMCSSAAC